MTDKETADYLREYIKSGKRGGPFGWPTDPCGYDQHIKFVEYRNKEWADCGLTWDKFVLNWADRLDPK